MEEYYLILARERELAALYMGFYPFIIKNSIHRFFYLQNLSSFLSDELPFVFINSLFAVCVCVLLALSRFPRREVPPFYTYSVSLPVIVYSSKFGETLYQIAFTHALTNTTPDTSLKWKKCTKKCACAQN